MMCFDNVLAVVAASKGNFHIMVIGLLLSVFLCFMLITYKHQGFSLIEKPYMSTSLIYGG